MSGDRDVEELLASDDPADRLEAVRSLGGRPRRQAVPVLLEALSDPVDEVSGEAATRLRELGTAEAVPALVCEYTRPDRFPGTHPAEIPYYWALEELGVGQAWEPLVDALEEATEPAVVNRCVRLLADLNTVRARPALERLADLDTDDDLDEDDVRAMKARGTDLLGSFQPGETVEFPSGDDLDGDDIRAMKARGAELVLDELDGAEATSTLDEVRRGLEERDYDERQRAERRLHGWIGAADTEDLISALRDDNNRIAAAAAKALGTRGAAEAVPGLVREVSKVERCVAADVSGYAYAESSDLRHSEHARALVRIDDRAAVEPLLDALDRSDNAWVTWEILWVLGWLGDPQALEVVEGTLEELDAADGSGWRYRALVSNAKTAVARLRKAAEGESE